MRYAQGRSRWVRAIVAGAVAGFLPVPLVLGSTLIGAELSGAEAQILLPRMGLVFGLGGGAALALVAGWWVVRKAGRAPVTHGLVAGTVAAIVGVVMVLAMGGAANVPLVIAWLLRPPAGAFGGWVAGGADRAGPPAGR